MAKVKTKGSKSTKSERHEDRTPLAPSMTVAFTIYAVVPVLILAVITFFYSTAPPDVVEKKRHMTPPVPSKNQARKSNVAERKAVDGVGGGRNYEEEVKKMTERKMRMQEQKQDGPSGTVAKKAKTHEIDKLIRASRDAFERNPDDVFNAISLGENLRQRDLVFHDGGSTHVESIATYEHALKLLLKRRDSENADTDPTDMTPSTRSQYDINVPFQSQSTDFIICNVYSSLAKVYFMRSMFDKSVEAHDEGLSICKDDLDSLTFQASSFIILGRYEEAAENYVKILKLDKDRIYGDVFSGMPKVLVAKEEAVPGGWDTLVDVLNEEIPKHEAMMNGVMSQQTRPRLSDFLFRMYHAMFTYHDAKTKNTTEAWKYLEKAFKVKMANVPKWNTGIEKRRGEVVQKVFVPGFWPEYVGSNSQTPVFIIGFVRTGSTLLERVLDSHPLIVGTGEDSVFNGNLEMIRNKIVEASSSQNRMDVKTTVDELGDFVVKKMQKRWEDVETLSLKSGKKNPVRFVDKMLTNYMNVGFIHMVFPKALILHVAREPMDTAFSAFKHEFPSGTLDYTGDFNSLTELYLSYRDIIEHWDRVLPGRVTHVRYEDMVRDLPGVSKAIIKQMGLEWDDEVLQFHKKKQAVNTLSTSQVRKGVYSHSIKSWQKYETQLQPLVKLLGDRVNYPLKTSVKGYKQISKKM